MTISTHGLDLSGIQWNHKRTASARRKPDSGRAFHYISDNQDLLWHPHNGRYYDSKSAFRKVTREAGCEEVGNETQSRQVQRRDKGEIGRNIKNAIEKLRAEQNR